MRDILFMGEIMASVTHEMQNVMAIIKESGALADDILALNGRPKLKHGDKLNEALTNVQQQVARGRELMLMLNGFAHAAADYPACCDLRRFAKQISVLADRMVRMKECKLVTDFSGPPLPVRGNALMLMQTVYQGLAALLAGCVKGDTLTIRAVDAENLSDTTRGGGLRLEAAVSRETPDVSALAPVMALLGAFCEAGPGTLELAYAPGGEAGDRTGKGAGA